MTARVVTVSADTSVAEIARLMLTHRIGAIPVVDSESHVVGIVSDHDLLGRPAADSARSWWLALFSGGEASVADIAKACRLRAEDVMHVRVRTVSEETPINTLGNLMQRHRLKHVPVTRHGKLVGIVSRSDLLAALLGGHDKVPLASPEYRFFNE